MRRVLPLAATLLSLLALQASAQPDTSELRMQLANRLVELQWPQTEESLAATIDSYEIQLPPGSRREFRASFDRAFDRQQVRRYSALVIAKDMSAEEISALLAFYASPAGHAVMLKMPQVLRDTVPMMQMLLSNAMRRLPNELRPPQYRATNY